MNDLNTMGFLFETLCVRDLRVFAEALECDAVVHLRSGPYGLIEIKLGGQSLIEEGVKTLNKLADRIDTTKMRASAFKMVLTAAGAHAYRRPEEGVYVVPIGCLKP